MSESMSCGNPHEQSLAELQELAAQQPKVGLLEPGMPTVHIQYRGNFYNRFGLIKAVAENRADDGQVFYVRMVKERFGLDLMAFYAEQTELCDAICDAVDAKEPYDKLIAGYAYVSELESTGELPYGSSAGLQVATGHTLGIEAIGIHYWSQINPLLEQAYDLIDARTLNAPFLTK